MMRILELFGEPIANGGEEAFVINCLSAMDLTDKVVDLVTPYYCDNKYYEQVVCEKGGKIVAFNNSFVPGKSRANIIKPLNNYLANNKYDIIHIHSGSISVLALGALVAYKNGNRHIIVHSHSSGEKENLKHRVLKFIASIIYDKCVWKYCACSKLAAKWKFPNRIAERSTVILKNGIDVSKYRYDVQKREEYRKLIKVDEDTCVVGHVGRFSYEKNHVFLINVFYKLLQIKQNCKLLLIGDGEELPKIKGLVKKLGIEDYVIFQGRVNNVGDYLQAMDVFVFPSLFEGLGIVCIEVQASGLPVVASDNTPKDIKLLDSTVFLSLESAYEEWADVIYKLWKNTKRTDTEETIIQNGFDIESTVGMLDKLYATDNRADYEVN